MPGLESGRSRRRRESSSDSRRRRRDRRRRDRTRSRERSRGRSPRSRRSEGSSSLPVAEPGYRWCQISETVLQGGTGPAVRLPPPPAPHVQQLPPQQRGSPVEASSSWQQNPWQPFQRTWGQQSWSQRGSGSSSKWKQGWGQQREKGWNKWPKKDEGRDWAKQDLKDKPPEGGEVSAAAPNPRKILTKWRWPHRKRLMRLQLGRPSVRRKASTPNYGRTPLSRLWLILTDLCVSGSWSRMAA